MDMTNKEPVADRTAPEAHDLSGASIDSAVRHCAFIGKAVEITRDKIDGIFLGIAIGDALGFPVETRTRSEIAALHGRLDRYVDALPNDYGPGAAAGTCTDDFQLSEAVAEALIASGGLDLDAIAAAHVRAMRDSTLGWGGSTKEAVIRIEQGSPPLESGRTAAPNRGTGNGVVMKIAPLALAVARLGLDADSALPRIAEFARMTHDTHVAVASAFAHVGALLETLRPGPFDEAGFVATVVSFAKRADGFLPRDEAGDRLIARLERLPDLKALSPEDLERELGGGSSSVFDSLPYTYAHFLAKPAGVECLIDLVNAGGDTDSNAALAGALLAARDGRSIFPAHLVEGVATRDRALDVAARFAGRFGVSC